MRDNACGLVLCAKMRKDVNLMPGCWFFSSRPVPTHLFNKTCYITQIYYIKSVYFLREGLSCCMLKLSVQVLLTELQPKKFVVLVRGRMREKLSPSCHIFREFRS